MAEESEETQFRRSRARAIERVFQVCIGPICSRVHGYKGQEGKLLHSVLKI